MNELVRGAKLEGGARQSAARQVPQQLREARAFRAGQDRGDQLPPGRRRPHLPPRPPHHGAGAEFLVPADRPEPATFTSIPKAKPEDFKAATQRVYHAAQTPSGLQLLVMPGH
jgi:hypothetical protein